MYKLHKNPNKKLELYSKESFKDFYRIQLLLYIERDYYDYLKGNGENKIETGVKHGDFTIGVNFYKNGYYHHNDKNKKENSYNYTNLVEFTIEIYKDYITSVNSLENLTITAISLIKKYIEDAFRDYENFVLDIMRKERKQRDEESMLERIVKMYL